MDTLDRLWDLAHRTGDRGAIAVLADSLVERGQARGLFMQLMLAGGRAAWREAAGLLEQHREVWLGRFAELAVPGTDVWRDGLLRGFRPDEGSPWPAPSYPGWRSIEQLDLLICGLDVALPVFDELHIPLRALYGLSGADLQTVVCRPSPRERLEVLGSRSRIGEPSSHLGWPVRLEVGTLVARGPLASPKIWGSRPPSRVHFSVPPDEHRGLAEIVEGALAFRQHFALPVGVEHTLKGAYTIRVVLDSESHTTVWLRQGELPVGWKTLRQLARAGIPLRVVGEVPAPLSARLGKRYPAWVSWEHVSEPEAEQTELRSLWGSWQLRPAWSVPSHTHRRRRSVSIVLLDFSRPGLIDGFDSGRDGPLEPEYPPR